MKRLCWMIAVLLLAVAVAGCGAEEATEVYAESDVSIRPAVTEADPETAVQKVYEALPDARTRPLTLSLFEELFPDLGSVAEEYYGRISDVNGGLADLIVIKRADGAGNRDKARDALWQYQEKRVSEFENYDILDAYSIARDAEVFDQGDYVVLLMMPDNEAAREIIDQYIPL